jgi:hypothetical protein
MFAKIEMWIMNKPVWIQLSSQRKMRKIEKALRVVP